MPRSAPRGGSRRPDTERGPVGPGTRHTPSPRLHGWRSPRGEGEEDTITPRDRDLALHSRRLAAIERGDERAANALAWEIALHYRPLAAGLATRAAARLAGLHLDPEDLTTEALIGVHHAAEIWDPSRASMMTHAHYWARSYLYASITRTSRTVRLPSGVVETLRVATRAHVRLGAASTTERVAAEVGVTPERLRSYRQAARVASLDLPTPGGDLMVEVIPDERPSPEDQAIRARLLATVADALGGLTPTQAEAIRLRYGIGAPAAESTAEVGRWLDVSKQAAQCRVTGGIRRLREAIHATA